MRNTPAPENLPCSPTAEVDGMAYFPRMLAKIRLEAEGKLWDELRANLGKGQDASCVEFLHIDYESLRTRVLRGGSDAEILEWSQEQGRRLNETDKQVWRYYVTKLGWNDHITSILARRKVESGLADRDDIVTMPHYIDVDEGRAE
jgi:gluconokinase